MFFEVIDWSEDQAQLPFEWWSVSSFGQHGDGFFAGVRTIRGERPAAQATRRPLSYGRCRIADCDFNQLL